MGDETDLWQNKTNNREVANCTALSLTAFYGKGRNDGCRAFSGHLKSQRWSPCGSGQLAQSPPEIDRACMQYAIRNSEPGSLLVEDSKLKMDSNTSVYFDIPGGRNIYGG